MPSRYEIRINIYPENYVHTLINSLFRVCGECARGAFTLHCIYAHISPTFWLFVFLFVQLSFRMPFLVVRCRRRNAKICSVRHELAMQINTKTIKHHKSVANDKRWMAAPNGMGAGLMASPVQYWLRWNTVIARIKIVIKHCSWT